MKRPWLIILILVSLFSCSQGGKTESKLSFTIGNLASPSLSNYSTGGAMLYGQNVNNFSTTFY